MSQLLSLPKCGWTKMYRKIQELIIRIQVVIVQTQVVDCGQLLLETSPLSCSHWLDNKGGTAHLLNAQLRQAHNNAECEQSDSDNDTLSHDGVCEWGPCDWKHSTEAEWLLSVLLDIEFMH